MVRETNPMSRLMKLAAPYRGKFILSVILAVFGVAAGLLPFFAVSRIVVLLMEKETSVSVYMKCCLVAGLGFLAKVCLSNLSTLISHTATFATLAEIRLQLADKLTRVPMGYMVNTPSGELKNVMVDRVEGIEMTLAHLLPELTANLCIPVCILIYLLFLDWRMAFAALITLPVGMLCYKGMANGYEEKFQGLILRMRKMTNTVVEYIGGIEVIKAFNQSADSYQKYTDAVEDNASYAVNWMRSVQVYKSMLVTIWPSVLVCVLPIGCILYRNGSLGIPAFLTCIVLSLMLLKIWCSYISDFGKVKTGYFMCAEKRIHIGNRIKYMPMGYFGEHNLGNLTSVVTTTMGDMENNASTVLTNILGGYIHAAIVTVVMLCIDWRIGATVLCGILLFTWCVSRLQKKSEAISPQRQKAQEMLVSHVLEYVQGMLIVKSFHLGQNGNSKIKRAILDSRDKNLKLERTFVPYNMLQQIILYRTSVLAIAEGLCFYLNGTMELSVCLLMTVASFMLFGGLSSAGNTSALLRLLDVSIDKVEEIDKTPVMDEHGKSIKPQNYDIVFDDVSFSYEEQKILDHVSLTIPEKTTTAIVGPSGAGKSTLCNLIARFFDVDGGKITIGGTDIRDYTLDSLLAGISEVFQKVYLFADTIENNIKFGNPQASHEEVVEAAKKACCHDFIMSLPDGYDTVIGESGESLSGGEKQRISIARAILKDAPIIILDEATSSVDPENENLLMQAIAELTKDKTVIMIAHRLKTVRNADQIFVLSDSHIVQRGTHGELIRQPGIYADFIGVRKKAIGWKLKQT